MLATPLLKTIALAIASGNAFLPDAAAYDDLVYKIVEIGDSPARFKAAYKLNTSQSGNPSPIDILVNVSGHYRNILEAETGNGRVRKSLSPREVNKIIRQGYETLDVPAANGLDSFEKYREADERGLLKKAARLAIEDARRVLRET